jgi:4-hydroxy-4-methyl-2-oxoglutarate aldolase
MTGPDPRTMELGTSTVSDALDWAGVPGQLLGIRALRPGMRMVGRAYTVRYEPCDVVPESVGDFVDDVAAGEVVVIDNGGRLDATVWGDLMTIVASQNGIAGTVIDGVCRDYDRAAELDYPMFSRGNFMRTGKDRVQVAEINRPVDVAGSLIRPGDLMIGDSDGVVVVPAAVEEKVLERAWFIHETENRIRDRVQGGGTLRESRAQLGYHALQTRAVDAEAR